MEFEFATAARILFRSGAAEELPRIAREFGTRALVVTGKNPGRLAQLTRRLETAGLVCSLFSAGGEPTLDTVRRGVEKARQNCDLVIGIGGGSAIDAAKAIAALTTNSGEPLDYLEVIGKGQSLEKPPLPFIAVPTTAGAGAEVTRNAVLGAPEHGVKASLRSPFLLAKVAVVDPELTFDLPAAITANTGLDTLTQLIEPYVSLRANVFTDQFCREGLARVSQSLIKAYRQGHDRAARESMSFASLLSGLALANAGLGVVHGFAAPLGGMLQDAPHGALCAAVLPHGMTVNIRALRKRGDNHAALERYRDAARILSGDSHAEAEYGAAWVTNLCARMQVPPLATYGLERDRIPALVEKAAKANSMKSNPVQLTADELIEVATLAL
jgi:alcohol dehydrogenase class IV